MKKEVCNCFVYLANAISMVKLYNSSNEATIELININCTDFINELKKYVDLTNLSLEEAEELGFRLWSEDTPGLYLIPLYLLPLIPVGMELTTINGRKVAYDGHNIDDDNRFGYLAYGIVFEEDESK